VLGLAEVAPHCACLGALRGWLLLFKTVALLGASSNSTAAAALPTIASEYDAGSYHYDAPNHGAMGSLVIAAIPKADGLGSFQFGIRFSPNSDGTFDLITLLTKQ